MPTKYPLKVNQQSDQPALPSPDSADERIAQVENGLVRMNANGQPQWGSTATLAERMAVLPGAGGEHCGDR